MQEAQAERADRQKPEYSEKQMFRLAARLFKLSEEPTTSPDARAHVESTLKQALAGYAQGEREGREAAELQAELNNPRSLASQRAMRVAEEADVPAGAIRAMFEKVRPDYHAPSSNPFVFTMEQLSRPVQAVTSGVAEWSRQAEEEGGFNIGPLNLRLAVTDPGEVFQAAGEGFDLERHDTPGSIAEEAGRIRQRQGKSTEAFGVLPGTDLRKGEVIPYAGKAGRVAFDVGGMAALDPLTYFTLGTSAAAKSSLGVVERAFGAEKAAEVARRGLQALSAEERARLTKGAVDALRGAQGGVGVRVPFRGGKMLSEPRTIVPQGPVTRPVAAAGRRVRQSKAGAALAKPGERVERVFRPRAGVRQAERAGDLPSKGVEKQLYELESTRDATVSRAIREDVGKITHATRAARATDADLAEVGRALDIGGARDALEPRLRPVFDAFDEVRRTGDRSLLSEAQRVGILADPDHVRALGVEPIAPEDYFPRVLTDEWRDYAGKPGKAGTRHVADPLSAEPGPYSWARRSDRELPVTQVNEAKRADTGLTKFEEDPLRAFTERIRQGRRDVGNRDFVTSLRQITDGDGNPLVLPLEDFIVPGTARIPGAPVQVDLPPGHIAVDVPGIGDVVVHESIADSVKRVAAMGSSEANPIKRGYDKVLRLWKSYATVPFPFSTGFSIRNQIGNMWNNYLAGIAPTDPVYVTAGRLRLRAERGMREGDPLKYLSGEQRELVDAAYDQGVLGEGLYTTDFARDVERQARPRFRDASRSEQARRVGERVNPVDAERFLPLDAGTRFNSFVEDTSRLAHFIKKRREFGDDVEAGLSAKKYLFDYNDLTAAEREVFKRISPFYTWMRKNVPLQLEAIAKQPGKFVHAEILRRALTDAGPGYESEHMPQWMVDAGASVPAEIDGTPVAWIPDTPYQSAGETLQPITAAAQVLRGEPASGQEFARSIVNAMGIGGPAGIPKALLEVATGRETFSGRPFYPGERVDVPSYLEPLNQLGLVPDTIPRWQQHLIEAGAPLASKLRTAIPNDPRDEDAAVRRWLATITGQSFWPLGEPTRRGEALRRLDLLAGLRSLLQGEGYEPPSLRSRSEKPDEFDEPAQPRPQSPRPRSSYDRIFAR